MDKSTIFIVVIPILFVIFCFYMAIKTSKTRKKGKKNRQTKLNAMNANFDAMMKHFYGLPVAQGVMINCFWCKDKVVFESSGASFNLDFSKLTDVSIKSDVEIQKSYVSSTGGAIAGAVMFGALGAMIGGRTKEKTSKQVTQYLIFTYIDNNEVKYIAFECVYLPNAQKFVNAFKQIKPETMQSFNL